jgi:predicted DNA-binding antitoxin AbrB/MazE fold protein
MAITVEAIYEDGVLKPAQPLPLQEHERVSVTVEAKQPSLAERIAARARALPPEVLDALSDLAGPQPPRYISEPRPTPAQFEQLLSDLAAGPPLPVLPADFSRADIYDDHD